MLIEFTLYIYILHVCLLGLLASMDYNVIETKYYNFIYKLIKTNKSPNEIKVSISSYLIIFLISILNTLTPLLIMLEIIYIIFNSQ